MNTVTSSNLMEAHNQWATRPADQRFSDLESLQTAVSERRANSRATDILCEKLEAKFADGKLLLNGTIQASEPSHWAFGQLAQHIGKSAGVNPLVPDGLRYPQVGRRR